MWRAWRGNATGFYRFTGSLEKGQIVDEISRVLLDYAGEVRSSLGEIGG